MRSDQQKLVGVGLYGPIEAARLSGASVGQVRKWLLGHDAHGKIYDPLWPRQISDDGLGLTLGFHDLIQLRVARAFIEAGLSAQKVRKAIRYAQEVKGHPHPLARSDFHTDGTTVFMKTINEDGAERLIDLFRNGQYVMKKIIEPSLRGVEYDSIEAVRWRPLAETQRIVIDPKRQFGAPIDDESGVPSRILAAAVHAEGSVESAAKLYRVATASVRQAVQFEKKLAA